MEWYKACIDGGDESREKLRVEDRVANMAADFTQLVAGKVRFFSGMAALCGWHAIADSRHSSAAECHNGSEIQRHERTGKPCSWGSLESSLVRSLKRQS